MKKVIGIISALFLAIPNGILTAICFFALIGNLAYIFGVSVSGWIHLGISIFIGVGLTLNEAMTHMDAKDKGYTIQKTVVLLLFTIINVFAGNYRVEESHRQARMDARQLAQNDPRWLQYDKEQASYETMMNNRYAGDDAKATEGMAQVAESRNALVQEYVEDSHVSAGSVGVMGLGSSWFLNLLWVTINIAFGLAVRIAYPGNDEEEETKPFNTPALAFKKTSVRAPAAPTSTIVTAQGQTIEQTKKPQGIGFHASWRESDLPRQSHKDLPVGFTSPAPADREVETRIVYVDRIKDGEHTNTVIKKKPDLNKANNRLKEITDKKHLQVVELLIDNKSLPKDERLKNGEIAKRVGYPDATYISKIKKKYKDVIDG